MSNSTAPFRIWIAGNSEWLPGPQFNSLEHALANAHKLAATGEVAIELPTRHWHTFEENGEQFLGPDSIVAPTSFPRGSQTDLTDRANAVVAARPAVKPTAAAAQPADGTINRAYKLTLGGSRTQRATPAQPVRRISSTHVSTPRTIESTTMEGVTSPEQASRELTNPGARSGHGTGKTGKPDHERREGERYDAKLILRDPACSIDRHRTEILDVSESGFRISIPAGVRINVAGRVVLVFSGRHGCFELTTHACWANGRQAGLHVDKGSGNLVGQMFLRKMISKAVELEAKRKQDRRRR